ncbi:MAG: DUF1223 domain-containing protein [Roseovarius sp.]
MRKTLINALAALLLAPAPGLAGDQPVVVELFTAQGCPSCPPADAFLAELAARDDVIALSLHVDYWDYIGWEDTFARPENTARQRGYARAQGHKMVYTPQMIINGRDYVVGTHRTDVIDVIDRHLAKAQDGIDLDVTRDGDTLRLTARAAKPRETALVVQLARITPEARVEIKRGENAGRMARYVNIVTGMERLAEWDTHAPLVVAFPAPRQGKGVILLQEGAFGPIVAATRIGP